MKIENQHVEVKEEASAAPSSATGLQVEEKRRRAWEQVTPHFSNLCRTKQNFCTQAWKVSIPLAALLEVQFF